LRRSAGVQAGRPAVSDDAAAGAAIHADAIAGRQPAFETDPPPASAFVRRIEQGEPLMVAERDGRVIRWASTLPYSDRRVYSSGASTQSTWTLVSAALGRRGVDGAVLGGRHRAGYYKLTSTIFASSGASLALAQRYGFRRWGCTGATAGSSANGATWWSSGCC
jgi:L-amino acid N-acyltransferase YncA